MAISKIILNGVTQMDVTQDTVASNNLLSGYTATKNDGTKVSGSYVPPSAPIGNIDITHAGQTDVTNYATATVAEGDPWVDVRNQRFYTNSQGKRKFVMTPHAEVSVANGDIAGFIGDGFLKDGNDYETAAIASGTSVTPSTSSQTIGGAYYMMEGAVTVNAVPSGSLYTHPFHYEDYDCDNLQISVDADSGVVDAYMYNANIPRADIVESAGWLDTNASALGFIGIDNKYQLPTQAGATITPTESAQTAVAKGKFTTGAVTVSAIPSNYVGSGITQRSSTDLTVSGATVTAPSGYYSASASKSVASGTAGTPTATKGTVSNHSVSVTPSVTNTTGYITGSTKTGTAVSVSASELVSGTLSVNSAGTKDVTNYALASIPSGTEGTPIATKGTVSNHSISVTPSVTNTNGFINGSTKTGTAVTVSASELVSGSETKTANGTYNVTNLASLVVNVPSGEDGDNLYYGSVDLTGTSWTFDNAPANLPEEESEFLHINLTAKHLSGSQLNSYNSLDFVDNQYGTMIVYGGNIAYDAGTWYEDKTINITGGTDATSKELYNILKANATQTT